MKALSGKQKTCKACREKFKPDRPMQSACSPRCAIELVQKEKDRRRASQLRAERKEAREARDRIKSRSEWLKEAQAAFNEWVRYRDRDLPCVSCGRFHQGQWHAGHYRTVGGNPELRFEPLNVWKQCAPCNNHKSGDIVNYRIELVRRIGAKKVEWLEGPHEPKRYRIEDLKAIKAEYKAKTREIKRQLGA